MLRLLMCISVLSVAHCQMFRSPQSPSGLQTLSSFLTPPAQRRQFNSDNLHRNQESFISGATPLFRPKVPSPRGPRLPLASRPHFGNNRFSSPTNQEIRTPVSENVVFDEDSRTELGSSNDSPNFAVNEDHEENEATNTDDNREFQTEPSFFDQDEPIDEESADKNEVKSESQIFEYQNEPESRNEESNNGFKSFLFDDENEENEQMNEDSSSHKREVSDSKSGFHFPSFFEASNQNNRPSDESLSTPSRLPLNTERNHGPPVYKPNPEPHSFPEINFRSQPSAPAHGFSVSGGSENSFNLKPKQSLRRPAVSRPNFTLREQSPERPRYSPQERFQDEPEAPPSYNEQEPSFNTNIRRRPQNNQDSAQYNLRQGGTKRRPLNKPQREQFYESANNENFLYAEEEQEQENKPDRLQLLLLETKFNCVKRKDGYYADEEIGCEVFHFCQDGVKHSWLCPNGGSFHQVHLICLPRTEDNICEKSSRFHFVNDYLYQETSDSTDRDKSYVQRYYPEGYEEGIAVLEDRHSISEQSPPPPKPYRTPQSPPRAQYNFENEPPRQVQLGVPLRQAQRRHFEERQQQEQSYNDEFYDAPEEESLPPSEDFDLESGREEHLRQEPTFEYNQRPNRQEPNRRQFSSFNPDRYE